MGLTALLKRAFINRTINRLNDDLPVGFHVGRYSQFCTAALAQLETRLHQSRIWPSRRKNFKG